MKRRGFFGVFLLMPVLFWMLWPTPPSSWVDRESQPTSGLNPPMESPVFKLAQGEPVLQEEGVPETSLEVCLSGEEVFHVAMLVLDPKDRRIEGSVSGPMTSETSLHLTHLQPGRKVMLLYGREFGRDQKEIDLQPGQNFLRVDYEKDPAVPVLLGKVVDLDGKPAWRARVELSISGLPPIDGMDGTCAKLDVDHTGDLSGIDVNGKCFFLDMARTESHEIKGDGTLRLFSTSHRVLR